MPRSRELELQSIEQEAARVTKLFRVLDKDALQECLKLKETIASFKKKWGLSSTLSSPEVIEEEQDQLLR